MANGFLSQIAASRAGGQATGGLAGLQIRRTGYEEMRSIEDEIRTMEEKLAEEEESARKREGRRGRGRLSGALLGGGLAAALTGGASLAIGLGAGLGSAAGQELGSRGFGTKAGIGSRKRYLDQIRSGLDSNEGMFFKGERKDVDLKRNKINKFLRDANRQFDDSIIAGSLTDALSGFQIGQFAKGGGFKDMFGKKKPTASQLATNTSVGSSSPLGAGTLDKTTQIDLLDQLKFNKPFYGDLGGNNKLMRDLIGDYAINNPFEFGRADSYASPSRSLYNLFGNK